MLRSPIDIFETNVCRYVLEDAAKELEKCQGQTKITEEIWHYLRM